MTKEEYAEYLQSEHWKDLRKQRLRLDGWKCQKCGSRFNLNVHHLKYCDDPRQSAVEDLQTLCRPCHATIHNKPIGKLRDSFEKAKRRIKAWKNRKKAIKRKFAKIGKWRKTRLRMQRDNSRSNSHWIIFPRNASDSRGVLTKSKST